MSSAATAVRHASGGSSSASNLPTVSFRPGQTAIVAAPRQAVVAAAGQQSNTTPATDTSGTYKSKSLHTRLRKTRALVMDYV